MEREITLNYHKDEPEVREALRTNNLWWLGYRWPVLDREQHPRNPDYLRITIRVDMDLLNPQVQHRTND